MPTRQRPLLSVRQTLLYQNSQTLTHAAGVLPGHPLQKRTEVQWDIGTALGADDGADESTSPQVGISRAIKAGELLKEAKAKLPHGEWLSWLKKQCELSQRTAQRYMKSCGGQAEARTKAAGEIRHSGGFDLEPGCRATQTAA